MATEEALKSSSFVANEDLSALQYHLVKAAGDDKIASVTASTDKVIGVLQNEPASGEVAEVAFEGISKVVAGASFSAGDFLAGDSSSRAIPVTGTPADSALGSARKIVGIATKGTAAADEVGSVHLDKALI